MKELEHDPARDATSVLEYVMTSHEYRNALLAAKVHVDAELLTETDEARKKALTVVDTYLEKEKLTCHGEEERAKSEAVGMLRVLGFDETGEQAPLNSLSGGLSKVF
jgi:ATPase subunit of ABC transporter with duplicated ATPase domains